MSWFEVGLVVVFGVSLLISLVLLKGAFDLLKDSNRRMSIIMASYKSDLEMTLLSVHRFDEFIKVTEQAMHDDEEEKPKTTAYA